MIDLIKFKSEVLEVVKDVLQHCDKEITVLKVVEWALNEVSCQTFNNFSEIYIPKGEEYEKNS